MEYTETQTYPRIHTSNETGELSAALCKAQASFGAAIKGSQAQHGKYADISSIIDATLEHLNAEGILVTQHPSLGFHGDKPFVTITTRLQLKEQWMQSDLNVPATIMNKFDPQTVIAATTYGCRNALQAILVVQRADAESIEEEKPEKKPKMGTHVPEKGTPNKPPKANIPPSPFAGQETGVPMPSVGVPGLNQRMPTKEEFTGFLKRSRIYSMEILPKHFTDGSATLKKHLFNKTGVSDVKNLTFQQWTSILDDLDNAERRGDLKEYIESPLFSSQSA